MRIRTFTAPDMNRAMEMIRETLGDEAVIISTSKDSGGAVNVTAALDEREPQVDATMMGVEEEAYAEPIASNDRSGLTEYLSLIHI